MSPRCRSKSIHVVREDFNKLPVPHRLVLGANSQIFIWTLQLLKVPVPRMDPDLQAGHPSEDRFNKLVLNNRNYLLQLLHLPISLYRPLGLYGHNELHRQVMCKVSEDHHVLAQPVMLWRHSSSRQSCLLSSTSVRRLVQRRKLRN